MSIVVTSSGLGRIPALGFVGGTLVSVRDLQQQIRRVGANPGPIDGIWGERTKGAWDGTLAKMIQRGLISTDDFRYTVADDRRRISITPAAWAAIQSMPTVNPSGGGGGQSGGGGGTPRRTPTEEPTEDREEEPMVATGGGMNPWVLGGIAALGLAFLATMYFTGQDEEDAMATEFV